MGGDQSARSGGGTNEKTEVLQKSSELADLLSVEKEFITVETKPLTRDQLEDDSYKLKLTEQITEEVMEDLMKHLLELPKREKVDTAA